jgi:hypothetical protein
MELEIFRQESQDNVSKVQNKLEQKKHEVMWVVPTQPCAVVSIFKSYIRVIWVG